MAQFTGVAITEENINHLSEEVLAKLLKDLIIFKNYIINGRTDIIKKVTFEDIKAHRRLEKFIRDEEIRKALKNGEAPVDLAIKYNVSKARISQIKLD